VNWNGRSYLEDCLAALLGQQPPPDEVLLADNHSDDGSREFVAERFPQVRIVDTGRNGGPGLARNAGVQHARFERVLLLDNDVLLEPGCLASLARTLDAHPDAGIVQARSLCHDRPHLVHYDAADLHYLGLLVHRNWLRPLADASRPQGPVGAAVSLCLLTPRAKFLDAGGFHEELFFYFEDTDFSWRMRLRGHAVYLDPNAHCLHRGGTVGLSSRSAASMPARRTYYHSRNRGLVLLTCLRARTLVLLAPAQLLYTAVGFAFALVRGHAFAWLRGKLALLALLPRALAWRAAAQRARVCADRDLLVAAPLTMQPGVADRGARAALRSALDSLWSWHWRLVRRWCG
jgi:hypothetical protein